MQQPKRFQAPTLAEAYDAVRKELGEKAVILSTRKAFAPGLFGQPGRQFVEVVARVPAPEPAQPARPAFEQDVAAHDLVRSVAEAVASAPAKASAVVAETRTESRRATRRAPAPMPAPAPTETAPTEPFSRQLDEMRSMLERLVAQRVELRPAEPAALAPASNAALDRLTANDVPVTLASSLLAEVDSRGGDEALLAALERRMAAKMPPALTVNATRRRAMFLVGPSGAGKTTLAVRMALDLERMQGLRVVIASTDVNRAGAPQQLMAFGAATGIDTRLCYSPSDLEDLLAEDAIDVVIVDTAGHNGLRRDRMAELTAFVQAARQRMVLLTLPATMKASDMVETSAAFAAAGVDGLALTRCDETSRYGALAAAAIESNLGIAYTTHSDQVSDAPVPGNPAVLAAAAVRGAWIAAEPPVASPAPQRRTLARVG